MKRLVRGQRIKLSEIAPASTSRQEQTWHLEATIEGASADIDWCCFGLDSAGRLADDRFFVFYNQPTSPSDAVRWQMKSPHNAAFDVVLEALPPAIKRLVFTASLDGAGTMNQVHSGQFQLGTSSDHVATYTFTGADFDSEMALIIGELYWKEAWRFAAVGQGFKGGLSALLHYFGGEEIKDEAPAPPPSAPARLPSAPPMMTPTITPPIFTPPPTLPPSPFSPPPVMSAPIAPLPAVPSPVPQSVPAGSSLQTLIDAAAPGETLALSRDEYQGPITISKPLTLAARGSVLWAHQGPVIRINATGVTLRDLEIEVTVPEDAQSGGDVALEVAPHTAPRLEDVRVRGRVLGLGEDGAWSLPTSLQLGTLAPRVLNDYRMHVRVPVACNLQSGVAGLELQPAQLAPGAHEVTLLVRDIAPETLLLGHIEVRSPLLTRSIRLTGNTLAGQGTLPAHQVVLWRE